MVKLKAITPFQSQHDIFAVVSDWIGLAGHSLLESDWKVIEKRGRKMEVPQTILYNPPVHSAIGEKKWQV